MKLSNKNWIDVFPIIECINGNLNGDPDNEGAPRIVPDTQTGLVSGVSYKARIRACMEYEGNRIYCKRGNNLNDLLTECGLKTGKKGKDRDKAGEVSSREKFCSTFSDARTFGATICEGDPIRGAVQIPFFQSLSSVRVDCHTGTAPSREDNKAGTLNKWKMVPYGLYMAWAGYAPYTGQKNGVTDEDLETLVRCIKHAYDFQGSAALGMSCVRTLYVFQQSGKYRSINFNDLYSLVKPVIKPGVPEASSLDDFIIQDKKVIADVCSKAGIEFEIVG